ncbi:MAG: glycosyltransferase, partial [Gemmatimonadales bacterium]|nr:glycosyltransferase [Gemmatimonadales bacterium]NIN13290.1 glycosyltransferase [Gemmatimonadales bacterium]NIN51293.1 glycosyltransferase [Gemmatimonadales bacterium]NIP08757.1 glycosyltransferase [Gemmatimonadales bacterium]NIR02390.1 glycosyltransferase [Gemmatimonadales bacterium]
MPLATSILIPSFRRPERVTRCLESLGSQTTLPDEVIVVWQGDDVATRHAAEHLKGTLPYQLRTLHSPKVGVVPAENTAVQAASGDIVLLIDDDATAPEDWIERHLRHYKDPTVGAVGGPADNFLPDGNAYPTHAAEPQGRLTWYGKTIGNMHDQPETWRSRQPTEVHHLVGYNLSVRRPAVKIFEAGLRPYWQLFELDACLQVRAGGYRVLFDYGIVV